MYVWAFSLLTSWLFLTLTGSKSKFVLKMEASTCHDFMTNPSREMVDLKEWVVKPKMLWGAPDNDVVFVTSVIWHLQALCQYCATPILFCCSSYQLCFLFGASWFFNNQQSFWSSNFLCLQSLNENMWRCPSSSRALRLTTIFIVYDQRREKPLYSPKGGNIPGPWLYGNRENPAESPGETKFGRLLAWWQQRHLWQNILESWNSVKNDFRKSFQGNRKSLLTQLSKSQMEHISSAQVSGIW